jgi:hypothetical protein
VNGAFRAQIFSQEGRSERIEQTRFCCFERCERRAGDCAVPSNAPRTLDNQNAASLPPDLPIFL